MNFVAIFTFYLYTSWPFTELLDTDQCKNKGLSYFCFRGSSTVSPPVCLCQPSNISMKKIALIRDI